MSRARALPLPEIDFRPLNEARAEPLPYITKCQVSYGTQHRFKVNVQRHGLPRVAGTEKRGFGGGDPGEGAGGHGGPPRKVYRAGRTDAGVHAETYVANFRTTSRIPLDKLPLAANTRLPDDIVVVKATQVPDGFNAIGSCLKKEYTYRIYNSRLGNPFYVNRAWFYPKHLDETVMARAAAQFVGTHDFRAVRSVGTETKTTVRTVHYFDVERQGNLIECRVCANGFLYNMVRAMVGTVVYAAEGKLAPEDIPEILASGNRTLAGPTVPPGGLYMTKLWYEEDIL